MNLIYQYDLNSYSYISGYVSLLYWSEYIEREKT